MKKETRKQIDSIYKMWLKRTNKLLAVHNNVYCDNAKRGKAHRLMIEMAIRLRNIRSKLSD